MASLWFSPLFFLLTLSANRPAAVETTEELWPGLPSGVFQRPHCSLGPSSCCQMGEGFSFWLLSEDQPSGSQGGFLGLPYLSSYICLFLVGAWMLLLGLPERPSRFFSSREEERWSFPTWMDRCVSPCWRGHPILLEKEGKKKLSLVYKCNLYRTRRVVPKIFTTPKTFLVHLVRPLNTKHGETILRRTCLYLKMQISSLVFLGTLSLSFWSANFKEGKVI